MSGARLAKCDLGVFAGGSGQWGCKREDVRSENLVLNGFCSLADMCLCHRETLIGVIMNEIKINEDLARYCALMVVD